MNIHLIYVGIDAIAIAMVALVTGRIWQIIPRHKNAWLILAISIGAISYYLSARQDYGPLIPDAYDVDFGSFFPILNVLRNATTAFYVMLCHSIFRDHARFPRWLILLLVVQLFIEEPLAWFIDPAWADAHATMSYALYEITPSAIQLVFVGFALYWIVSERKVDLIETRRKLRLIIFALYVIQVVMSLVIERVAMGMDAIPWQAHYPIHMAMVSVAIVTCVIILYSLNSAESIIYLAPGSKPPSQPALDSTEPIDPDLNRIIDAFENERIYQTIGLSIGGLASHLSLPEYRLRALIHDNLGYRNFNALLHHYRIDEVTAALEDPAKNSTPILTLALSAGYQSINPFNRAFREAKNMTPTEYRRQSQNKHTDSSKSAPISSTNA